MTLICTAVMFREAVAHLLSKQWRSIIRLTITYDMIILDLNDTDFTSDFGDHGYYVVYL